MAHSYKEDRLHSTIREVMFWLPLIGAAVAVAASSSTRPLLPMLGIVSRELRLHLEFLSHEIERLRSHGLSFDGACNLVAEKVDVDKDELRHAHFDWSFKDAE